MITSLVLSSCFVCAPTMAEFDRLKDWRNGSVVYQIFVDRFVPPTDRSKKQTVFQSPRSLKNWEEEPKPGRFVTQAGLWSHELDFWGGDIRGVASKVPYLKELGVDTIYLNPIFEAYTNHKYDTIDWLKISPEFGTESDFKALIKDLKKSNLKIVLDGVFNHAGQRNARFQAAKTDAQSPYRDWFEFGKDFPNGYNAFANVANMPVMKLEHKPVRDYFWNSKNSVVAHYLNLGIDGWRLDVASELGFEYLSELTRAAHQHKKGSLVVGEVWVYPKRWTDSMDAVMNMHLGQLITSLSLGSVGSTQFGRAMDQMIADSGIEPILKSWIVLSNHDMQRIGTKIPNQTDRFFATALQYTLPGSPVLYYGDELGMKGGDDPANRGPMRWNLETSDNEELAWTKKLIKLHQTQSALKVGDYRTLISDQTLAFTRTTNNPLDTIIVVANPTAKEVTETIIVSEPTILGYTLFKDLLSNSELRVQAGTAKVKIPAKTVQVFKLITEPKRHDQYRRMKPGS
jgi:cyclomaltodextrinase / maltogenic alpha-amylase / neopullulanase